MIHLHCVHPFGKYTKGQVITDQAEIATLSADRAQHFVRVNAPAPAESAAVPEPIQEPDDEPDHDPE